MREELGREAHTTRYARAGLLARLRGQGISRMTEIMKMQAGNASAGDSAAQPEWRRSGNQRGGFGGPSARPVPSSMYCRRMLTVLGVMSMSQRRRASLTPG